MRSLKSIRHFNKPLLTIRATDTGGLNLNVENIALNIKLYIEKCNLFFTQAIMGSHS